MKNRRLIAVPLVFMIILGSFVVSRFEISEMGKVDNLLLIAFGVFLGIFLTAIGATYKR
ncbi:MAG: hypothetical protein Aureis2KO_17980 [Aureisphaera sp.]